MLLQFIDFIFPSFTDFLPPQFLPTPHRSPFPGFSHSPPFVHVEKFTNFIRFRDQSANRFRFSDNRWLGSTAGTWLTPLPSAVCISLHEVRSHGIFANQTSDGTEKGPYKGIGSHSFHSLGLQHMHTTVRARFRNHNLFLL